MTEEGSSSRYPDGVNVNKEVLDDLNNELPDEEIIRKLLNVSDLHVALWGDEGMRRTYVPLHHAASRGRVDLVLFILDNRPAPEYINFENNNYLTALRYATRNGLLDMVRILEEHGAVEEYPPLTIVCKSCGGEFTHNSNSQSKFKAEGYQNPKACQSCRELRKNNGRADGRDTRDREGPREGGHRDGGRRDGGDRSEGRRERDRGGRGYDRGTRGIDHKTRGADHGADHGTRGDSAGNWRS